MYNNWNNIEITLLKQNYKKDWFILLQLLPNRNKIGIRDKISKLKLKRGHNQEGELNPFYGKHHTEKTKKKIKQNHISPEEQWNYNPEKHKKHYCSDCKKEVLYYKSKRCQKCYIRLLNSNQKDKNNPRYIDGRSINKKQYAKWLRKNNLNYKLSMDLRRRLLSALKGNSKSQSTIKLLGCTIEKLKLHLENQFKKGMTWANWGRKGWHIDHIKPCASFDLSKVGEQRKCFYYTNLQPLWAKENLMKHCRI